MAVVGRSKWVPVLSSHPAPSSISAQLSRHLPKQQTDPSLGLINPSSPQFPSWLILLMAFRKISTPLLLLLVMGLLPVYAWRVNTEQSWGNQYTELEELQKDQRQWLTRNEERKHEISENLENDPAGYIPKSSKTSIFYQSAPVRSPKSVSSPPREITDLNTIPIGY